jgi:hypothetical protein
MSPDGVFTAPDERFAGVDDIGFLAAGRLTGVRGLRVWAWTPGCNKNAKVTAVKDMNSFLYI